MDGMARKTDPSTSHSAARTLVNAGIHGRQQLVAKDLLNKNPGRTFKELWEIHSQTAKRRGEELVFQDPPGLMRRLSEVGFKGDVKLCPIAGRKCATWWPA